MENLFVFLLSLTAVLATSIWALKLIFWIWIRPKKLERYLRRQGFSGAPYKLYYGDGKEIKSVYQRNLSKPMELSHQIMPRVTPFVHHTVEKYGKMCFVWYGPTPRVTIMEPDLLKEIMTTHYKDVIKTKKNPYQKWFVNGVALYDGEKWIKHRRIINPAFHTEKLKMMLPAFHESCSELISKWEKHTANGSCELDVWPDFQSLTGDVISRTSFGTNYEEARRIFQLQVEHAELFVQTFNSIYIPGSRFLPSKRNNRMKEIDGEVRGILRRIIEKREKAMASGDTDNNDLLGQLMESNLVEMNSENVGLSIDDIIEECKLFYFAGQETSSTHLVWTMILLSMHQDWQDKAREEVLQVFGKTKPDYAGLNRLKIVTMILHEVLRLYPGVSTLVRVTHKEMKIGKISLPAGVEIEMPTLLIHHDRELWGEDVDEFNPERFSGGVSKATNNQVSYIPFGWGPRTCIGQNFAMIEAKLAISMILQCFSFELSPSYTHAPHSIITLKPQHGAQILLHRL